MCLHYEQAEHALELAELMQDDQPERQMNWLVLAAVVGGVALFVWLLLAFLDWNKLQTCITEGRRHCEQTQER